MKRIRRRWGVESPTTLSLYRSALLLSHPDFKARLTSTLWACLVAALNKQALRVGGWMQCEATVPTTCLNFEPALYKFQIPPPHQTSCFVIIHFSYFCSMFVYLSDLEMLWRPSKAKYFNFQPSSFVHGPYPFNFGYILSKQGKKTRLIRIV